MRSELFRSPPGLMLPVCLTWDLPLISMESLTLSHFSIPRKPPSEIAFLPPCYDQTQPVLHNRLGVWLIRTFPMAASIQCILSPLRGTHPPPSHSAGADHFLLLLGPPFHVKRPASKDVTASSRSTRLPANAFGLAPTPSSPSGLRHGTVSENVLWIKKKMVLSIYEVQQK